MNKYFIDLGPFCHFLYLLGPPKPCFYKEKAPSNSRKSKFCGILRNFAEFCGPQKFPPPAELSNKRNEGSTERRYNGTRERQNNIYYLGPIQKPGSSDSGLFQIFRYLQIHFIPDYSGSKYTPLLYTQMMH